MKDTAEMFKNYPELIPLVGIYQISFLKQNIISFNLISFQDAKDEFEACGVNLLLLATQGKFAACQRNLKLTPETRNFETETSNLGLKPK